MPEESKRALVIAWSDLVCYAEYAGTVDSEWGFDDQDVQKFIGWRNNFGNFKGTDL
ncbi:hypothetical protein D3C86_1851120 [compost metagenome]